MATSTTLHGWPGETIAVLDGCQLEVMHLAHAGVARDVSKITCPHYITLLSCCDEEGSDCNLHFAGKPCTLIDVKRTLRGQLMWSCCAHPGEEGNDHNNFI